MMASRLKETQGAYLRAKHEYFTTLTDSTKCEIDELGNVSWALSMGATDGWSTDIPFGKWTLSAALGIDISTDTSISMSSIMDTSISATTDLSLSSSLNTSIDTGLNFSHSANGTYDVSSTMAMSLASDMNISAEAQMIFDVKAGSQLNLDGPIVQIGSSPSEPCVMGQQLSDWLQALCDVFTNNASKFGIGNMGAPVPLDPGILSAVAQLTAKIPLLVSTTITVSA